MPEPTQARWLDAALAAAGREPVELVCRTGASVRAVQARLVREAAGGARGWLGLSIATLWGKVQEAAPQDLLGADEDDPAPPLPGKHPWAQALADRPRLRRRLAATLDRLHCLVAAGASVDGLRRELEELRRAGWARSARADAVARFVAARPPKDRRRLSVGFGPAGRAFSFAGTFGALEQRLHAALGAEALPAGSPDVEARLAQRLPTLLLPDPVAEARAIAQVARSADDVLVLVADDASAARIRAALARNGVTVADDGAAAFTGHALASLLAPLVAVFESRGAEPMHHRDLVRLLTHPVLSRRAPAGEPPAAGSQDPAGEDAEALWLSPRHVRPLVAECRRVALPIAGWAGRLAARSGSLEESVRGADETHRGSLARRARTARALVTVLEAIGTSAAKGTLGALGELVANLGLTRRSQDRLGRALVATLEAAGSRRVTPETYDEVLAGAVASGQVEQGVRLVSYEEYDGRDAGLLLLAGVHTKGLGRVPSADPFLEPGDRAVLGLPPPREAVLERLALARWAVGRAGRALALASRTDDTGRDVSLPVDLVAELALDRAHAHASYGLEPGPLPFAGSAGSAGSAGLPELGDLGALATGGAAIPDDGAGAQVDAEWVRAGVRVEGGAATATDLDPNVATVEDYLRRDEGLLPERLRPYLGFPGAHPASGNGLPPGYRLSATRLEALAQCPYRAFAGAVLGLEKPDEVDEEHSRKELGSVLHAAFEAGTRDVSWVVPDDRVEAVRRELAGRLADTMRDAFVGSERELGLAGGEAATSGRRGLLSRWQRHLETYVEKRVRAVSDAVDDARGEARPRGEDPAFLGCPEGLELLAELNEDDPAIDKRSKLRQEVFDWISAHVERNEPLHEQPEAVLDAIGSKRARKPGRQELRRRAEAYLVSAEAKKLVQTLCTLYRESVVDVLPAPEGDETVVAAELGFGSKTTPAVAPGRMRLGASDVPVAGKIDSVVRLAGRAEHARAYRVIDYKSGKAPRSTRVVGSFVRPQLPFYALALGEHLAAPGAALPVLPVRSIAHDPLRGGLLVPEELPADTLERARATFGALLDRARAGAYPLLPHPHGCPHLEEGYCDLGGVCRHRASWTPVLPELDGEDAADEEGDEECEEDGE